MSHTQPFDFDTLANDRQVKMISTCYDKHITLTGDSVIIQCSDGTSITLGASGVTIETANNIIANASKKISVVSGEKITISAEEKISINCEDSFVEINPFDIKMYAEIIEMDT